MAAYLVKEADKPILLALGRFHYLTAAQVSRLLYPRMRDRNREAQRRLKDLTDAEYVLCLNALPKPQVGRAPHVYTLARKGRRYVQAFGVAVEAYFRPSEEKRASWNSPFMAHRLASIDVMIAAQCLCKEHPVVCPQMWSERELKRSALRVDVPRSPYSYADGMRSVAVIPDAWFQLSLPGQPPTSIAVEVDRATEDQKVWRQKVAAYVYWADGPYEAAFETDNLTIAVVCPDETRRTVLIDWTMRELKARWLQEFADLFLFSHSDPVATPPKQFFFGAVWHAPDTGVAVSLLDLPQDQQREMV